MAFTSACARSAGESSVVASVDPAEDCGLEDVPDGFVRGILGAAPDDLLDVELGEVFGCPLLSGLPRKTSSSKSLTYTSGELEGAALVVCSLCGAAADLGGRGPPSAPALEAIKGSRKTRRKAFMGLPHGTGDRQTGGSHKAMMPQTQWKVAVRITQLLRVLPDWKANQTFFNSSRLGDAQIELITVGLRQGVAC